MNEFAVSNTLTNLVVGLVPNPSFAKGSSLSKRLGIECLHESMSRFISISLMMFNAKMFDIRHNFHNICSVPRK